MCSQYSSYSCYISWKVLIFVLSHVNLPIMWWIRHKIVPAYEHPENSCWVDVDFWNSTASSRQRFVEHKLINNLCWYAPFGHCVTIYTIFCIVLCINYAITCIVFTKFQKWCSGNFDLCNSQNGTKFTNFSIHWYGLLWTNHTIEFTESV